MMTWRGVRVKVRVRGRVADDDLARVRVKVRGRGRGRVRVADDDLGAGRQALLPGHEPVGDLAGLLHEVAARGLVEILLAAALGLRLGEREDQRAG
tara:strand:- start:836 stop:1123 length:288 start_codon:yes stop_codon:yes gene_type:complete